MIDIRSLPYFLGEAFTRIVPACQIAFLLLPINQ